MSPPFKPSASSLSSSRKSYNLEWLYRPILRGFAEPGKVSTSVRWGCILSLEWLISSSSSSSSSTGRIERHCQLSQSMDLCCRLLQIVTWTLRKLSTLSSLKVVCVL